jgi:uncharacterized membrane protein YozB (DUF420 family)
VNYIKRVNKEREYIKIEMVNGVRVDGSRGRMDKNMKTLTLKRFANASLVLGILGYIFMLVGIWFIISGSIIFLLLVLLGAGIAIIAFLIGDEVVDQLDKDPKTKYPFYKTAKAGKLLGLILLWIQGVLGLIALLLPLILLLLMI